MEVFHHFSNKKDSHPETEQSARFGDGSLYHLIGEGLTNSPEEDLKRPAMFPQKWDDKDTV